MNKTLQICVFNEFYKTDIRRYSTVNISVLETLQKSHIYLIKSKYIKP